MIKKFLRWLLNKDELEAIRRELSGIRILLITEIERQQPKRNKPLEPLGPVENK
jgi:hypothetical protein